METININGWTIPAHIIERTEYNTLFYAQNRIARMTPYGKIEILEEYVDIPAWNPTELPHVIDLSDE